MNGNFTIGTVNSEERPALYDVQTNHAQSKDTKVANLWECKRSINDVSKFEASSKNAWTLVQKMATDFQKVKAFWIYQNKADMAEQRNMDETISNQGHHLKGLRKAVQSILSVAPREGKYTPPNWIYEIRCTKLIQIFP